MSRSRTTRALRSQLRSLIVALVAMVVCAASAQEPEPEPDPPAPWVLSAYVEAFYQLNFNRPNNGITNYRGFDNRHNTFTLSNLALGVQWDVQRLIGRVTLQIGHTPSSYYLSEPVSPGDAGANASSHELWKYVQQAHAGYRFDVGSGLAVAAGIFLSPTGPEALAIYDSWNWSRSNLFVGLPFYHTGVNASYALNEAWTLTLSVFNGWNSVVDNNAEKSPAAQLTYTTPNLDVSVLYFAGVERPRAAPEGRAWRHMAETHATWQTTSWLALRAHINVGFEPNHLGTSHWQAAAIYARLQLLPQLLVAMRGDLFREQVPAGASAIFWPAPWVSSATLTLDYRPHERASFRLEYRHDHAGGAMYFGPNTRGDGVDIAYNPDKRAQDTVTLGVTSWF